MGKTTELRKEIKKNFIPFVKEKGFSSSMRFAPVSFDFKKITDEEIWVFDIQWEKYGTPRFVVNFAKCTKDGVNYFGKHYSEKDITPAVIPISGRLQPNNGTSSRSWFRQDKTLLVKLISSNKQKPAEEVVNQLIDLFKELEQYFKNGEIGKHLHIC